MFYNVNFINNNNNYSSLVLGRRILFLSEKVKKNTKTNISNSNNYSNIKRNDSKYEEWDVVQYKSERKDRKRLGRIENIDGNIINLNPLKEESPGIWLLDLNILNEEVNVNDVEYTIACDYSQRMVQDRIINPHGEHAEEVWEINEKISKEIYKGN